MGKDAQIALAWLIVQKLRIVPIRGTGNLDHSCENLSSIHFQLTPEDLREIEPTFSGIKVHHGRMKAS